MCLVFTISLPNSLSSCLSPSLFCPLSLPTSVIHQTVCQDGGGGDGDDDDEQQVIRF